MTKEKKDVEVCERVVIEERDAALKRLSDMEKEISTLSETANKMTRALMATHDAEIVNIKAVVSRFHEGMDEVLLCEAFLKTRGSTSLSVPPQDP